MSLPTNESTGNGMRTYFFLDPETSTPKVRVTCETGSGGKKEYILPVSNMNYWYPLYQVYDYKYQNNLDELCLVLYSNATEEQKSQFNIIEANVQRYSVTDITLPSTINPVTGTVTDNKLHQINQSLLFQLEKYNIVTWNKANFTKTDVNNNFNLISAKLKQIKAKVQLAYHTDHGNSSQTVFSFDDLAPNFETREVEYYKYLEDEDARILIELGGAYTMTVAMSKILKLVDLA